MSRSCVSIMFLAETLSGSKLIPLNVDTYILVLGHQVH